MISPKQAVLNLVNPAYSAAQSVLNARPSANPSRRDAMWYKLNQPIQKNPPIYVGYWDEHGKPLADSDLADLNHNGQVVITIASYDEAMETASQYHCEFILIPLDVARLLGYFGVIY